MPRCQRKPRNGVEALGAEEDGDVEANVWEDDGDVRANVSGNVRTGAIRVRMLWVTAVLDTDPQWQSPTY